MANQAAMSVLDQINEERDNKPSAQVSTSSEFTPDELADIERQAEADAKALAQAELLVNGLRPGETLKRCPGCTKEWVGTPDSHQMKAYRGHVQRHAHAKLAMRALGLSI